MQSMVKQYEHERLKCPQFDCDEKLTNADVEKIVPEEWLKKF